MQKDSLAHHLKSEAHIHSVCAKNHRDSSKKAGDRLAEQEATEERMDFVALHSPAQHSHVGTSRPSQGQAYDHITENVYASFNGDFDAGIDPSAAAIDERRRLEQEADNFDMWRGAEFVPELDPNDSTLLLDELEQGDLLTELLQNAGK